ncbi:hypothetical protein BTURTLESOX_335 [bacterium endosymbiont of Bathymodiolus sp. 5 South]|nr:hypothetical protein BTURTLESOX_335 [bacterium endosymbiont of Bathymodiolus sp. 5 South]
MNALENVLFAIEALEKVFLKKWLNWGFVVFIMVISWLWCIKFTTIIPLSPPYSSFS